MAPIVDATPAPQPAKALTLPSRIIIGALGGFAAVASKLLGFDQKVIAAFLDSGLPEEAGAIKVLLLVHAPILIILGAIVAAVVDETVKLKLFAIGVSAPAVLTPWLANGPVVDLTEKLNQTSAGLFISNAYADDPSAGTTAQTNGLGYIFGVAPEPRYRVVVGSYTTIDAAIAAAEKMKSEVPDIDIYVGEKRPGNDNYPVVVGGENGFLPYSDAKALKSQVDAEKDVFVNGSYYSSYDFPVHQEIK